MAKNRDNNGSALSDVSTSLDFQRGMGGGQNGNGTTSPQRRKRRNGRDPLDEIADLSLELDEPVTPDALPDTLSLRGAELAKSDDPDKQRQGDRLLEAGERLRQQNGQAAPQTPAQPAGGQPAPAGGMTPQAATQPAQQTAQGQPGQQAAQPAQDPIEQLSPESDAQQMLQALEQNERRVNERLGLPADASPDTRRRLLLDRQAREQGIENTQDTSAAEMRNKILTEAQYNEQGEPQFRAPGQRPDETREQFNRRMEALAMSRMDPDLREQYLRQQQLGVQTEQAEAQRQNELAKQQMERRTQLQKAMIENRPEPRDPVVVGGDGLYVPGRGWAREPSGETPEVTEFGNGGLATMGSDGTLRVVREPDEQQQQPVEVGDGGLWHPQQGWIREPSGPQGSDRYRPIEMQVGTDRTGQPIIAQRLYDTQQQRVIGGGAGSGTTPQTGQQGQQEQQPAQQGGQQGQAQGSENPLPGVTGPIDLPAPISQLRQNPDMLREGAVYRIPGRGDYRWNGRAFEPVS